jgi:hypothetical protein
MTESRPTVVYIASAPRSGSTVLERILHSAGAGYGVGESLLSWRRGFIDDDLCSCGATFSRCPVWSEVALLVGAKAAGELAQLPSRMRMRAMVGCTVRRRVRADASNSAWRALAAMSQVGGATRLIDSSKNPGYLRLLAAGGGRPISVIHLVRDGRAVADSLARPKPTAATTSARLMATLPWPEALRYWRSYNLSIEAFSVGLRSCRVRYEDLADEGVMHRLVSWISRGATVTAEPGGWHSVAGNPDRVAAYSGFVPRLPESTHPPEDRVARGLLRRYGYEA